MGTETKRITPTWHLLPEMSQQQCTRVNLLELIEQFRKKIGREKTRTYFGHFEKLLSGNLAKPKFDELCCLTIGKENIYLHNHLIRSIFKNALSNKPRSDNLIKEVTRKFKPNYPFLEKGDFLCSPNGAAPATAFGGSQGKIRSETRARYCLSVNSPRPDVSSALQGAVARSEISATNALDNNDLSPDLLRPLLLSPASAKSSDLPEAEFNRTITHQSKRQRLPGELNEQQPAVWTEKPLTAPLGIPFFPGSVGSARSLTYTCSNPTLAKEQVCLGASELPDTETLRRRMEWDAKAKGFQDVSSDCANCLNHGMDAYLKKLIKASIDLKKGKYRAPYTQIPCRSTQEVNSLRPALSHDTRIAKNAAQKESCNLPVSLLNFKTAMELNPQLLGEDWPLQMEKLFFRLLDGE